MVQVVTQIQLIEVARDYKLGLVRGMLSVRSHKNHFGCWEVHLLAADTEMWFALLDGLVQLLVNLCRKVGSGSVAGASRKRSTSGDELWVDFGEFSFSRRWRRLAGCEPSGGDKRGGRTCLDDTLSTSDNNPGHDGSSAVAGER